MKVRDKVRIKKAGKYWAFGSNSSVDRTIGSTGIIASICFPNPTESARYSVRFGHHDFFYEFFYSKEELELVSTPNTNSNSNTTPSLLNVRSNIITV